MVANSTRKTTVPSAARVLYFFQFHCSFGSHSAQPYVLKMSLVREGGLKASTQKIQLKGNTGCLFILREDKNGNFVNILKNSF